MPVPEPPADHGLWPEVRAISGWPEPDEDGVRALADDWRRTGQRFIQAGGYDVGGLAGAWPDAAGSAFQNRARQHLRTAAVTGSEMVELARRADVFANEVTAVKTAIVNLIEANLPRYAAITADRVVFADFVRAQFVTEVAGMVRELVTAAAGRVAGAGGAPLGRGDGPPAGATPAQVGQWWNGLLPEQRAAILRDSPDLVRNLDGIPAAVRDEANRAVLEREITALRAREAELVAEEQQRMWQEEPPMWNPELLQVRDKLAGLTALQERLGAAATPGREPYLLGLDTADDGRAVVALGDPDTARNVATMVPGVGTDLGSVPGELDRAGRLWDAARDAGSASTSVVAWIGYDTPDEVFLAGSESYATGGKQALDSFQDGLRATHQGEPALQTVIGHSYGTTTLGHAARDESLAADRLVFVSSPGTGAGHASDLRLDGVAPEQMRQHVYATTPPNDPIRIANLRVNAAQDTPGATPFWVDVGHQIDPTSPEFGGQVFETAVGRDPHGASFEPGNPALRTLGEIIAGRR
ncbi:WXG100-like domain-containing protein [Plantactinospora sonchi]|uniref:Alpha/beta hydrolase n=1 Tax=Plantactinospora sonchi TaxID=1544735 RepID=A0ABU7RP41_9ACTN